MSFTDNWSDEEFIRQMKELIGNEGDIHVTCNHSEGEQVTETHVHAEIFSGIAIMATAKECGYALICPESKY